MMVMRNRTSRFQRTSKMKTRFALIVTLLLFCAGLSSASPLVFTGVSTGVNYSVNNPSGFLVSNSPISGPVASAGTLAGPYNVGFHLSATDPSYSDAGIVLFFNGGLTLGQLQSVNVDTTSTVMNINLWLDTGGDGHFFAFDSSGLLAGLQGDTYTSTSTTFLHAASSVYMQGGNGAGGTYSLAQLQNGAVSGITVNTRTALWVGITNNHTADITRITVNTVPEPAFTFLIAGGLIGIGLAFRRKRG
jgi:hypothetical protein